MTAPKLSPKQCANVGNRVSKGLTTQAQEARRFQVSPSVISDVVAEYMDAKVAKREAQV